MAYRLCRKCGSPIIDSRESMLCRRCRKTKDMLDKQRIEDEKAIEDSENNA